MKTGADILRKMKEHRQAFAAGERFTVEHRRKLLARFEAEVLARQAEIVEALRKDLNKSEFESLVTEVSAVLDAGRYLRKKLPRLAKARRAGLSITNFPGKSTLVPEPYGLALVIGTWNYPFLLALEPAIGAFAAGNAVVLKLSDKSPHTAAMVEAIIEAVFPEGEIVTVSDEIAYPELLKERYDVIFFTGGARGGREVLAAAAPYLTPVTLELGGKSPCIVDEDADLRIAARRIVWGKFTNAGQTCTAPDHLWVHSRVAGRLVEELKAAIRSFYGEKPLENPDYGRLVNRFHFDRVLRLLESGEVLAGGASNSETLRIEPTLLRAAPEDPAMAEEIFGPVLPVLTFDDLREVLEFIGSRPKPLALYYFGNDRRRREAILGGTSSGAVVFNDVVMHFQNPVPFGGVGDSGMGRYHYQYTFETFSHLKPVMAKPFFPDFPLRYPPFKEGQLKLARFLTRKSIRKRS